MKSRQIRNRRVPKGPETDSAILILPPFPLSIFTSILNLPLFYDTSLCFGIVSPLAPSLPIPSKLLPLSPSCVA